MGGEVSLSVACRARVQGTQGGEQGDPRKRMDPTEGPEGTRDVSGSWAWKKVRPFSMGWGESMWWGEHR